MERLTEVLAQSTVLDLVAICVLARLTGVANNRLLAEAATVFLSVLANGVLPAVSGVL